MGATDMQRTTATMNDAATRLSGYFLRQVLINSAYGTFIALGLWAIGVPSSIVWGILAMLMRFVPYVGPFIAAAPPVLLAAVVEPGWTMVLLTGGLFLVSELIMGQVIEPLVYGHGTGLSPIAVILSTVFWTWLWGPLGLLLAMPLTVCLVVLGRHVEALNFLEVLLGDKPALTPAQSFYQRALIGDSAEATYQAEVCLKKGRPLVDYLDEVALGGLKLAERDAERGSLDADNLESIEETVDEMMDNLTDFEPRRWFRKVEVEVEEAPGGLASLTSIEQEEEIDQLPILEGALAPGWEVEDAVLCIGARTPLDEAAGRMLAGVLQRQGLKARALPSDAISAAHIVSLEASKTKLVCLSYLGAGANAAHVRYLVRRLRRILPEGATVLVGFWCDEGSGTGIKALEATAEADAYVTSLKEAARFCVDAARGQEAEKSKATPSPSRTLPRRMRKRPRLGARRQRRTSRRRQHASHKTSGPAAADVRAQRPLLPRSVRGGDVTGIDPAYLRRRRVGDLYPAPLPAGGLVALTWHGDLDGLRLRRRRRPHIDRARNLHPFKTGIAGSGCLRDQGRDHGLRRDGGWRRSRLCGRGGLRRFYGGRHGKRFGLGKRPDLRVGIFVAKRLRALIPGARLFYVRLDPLRADLLDEGGIVSGADREGRLGAAGFRRALEVGARAWEVSDIHHLAPVLDELGDARGVARA